MKNYLQSSGVILLKDQECLHFAWCPWWLIVRKSWSCWWMTEVPVCESLRCVFFFLFLFCLLWQLAQQGWSSCLLEVVASSAGEKGGAYGSQDSHQVVSAQRKKKKQNKREQRHIAVFVVESANIRVVSSVQLWSAIVVPSFPYFSIPATPKEQWGKDGLVDGEGLWGSLHRRVGPRSLLHSVLPWAPHWSVCPILSL